MTQFIILFRVIFHSEREPRDSASPFYTCDELRAIRRVFFVCGCVCIGDWLSISERRRRMLKKHCEFEVVFLGGHVRSVKGKE